MAKAKAKSYKLKTNKAAAKRFTAVGNGKFKRGQMGKRHILTKKSAKRIRDLRGPTLVHPSDTAAIRQLLPNH